MCPNQALIKARDFYFVRPIFIPVKIELLIMVQQQFYRWALTNHMIYVATTTLPTPVKKCIGIDHIKRLLIWTEDFSS